MKFKTERRMRVISHGPEGQERALVEHYDERVPRLPRDWDQVAIKAAAGLVLALTMVAVVWSTTSIGGILHGVIGYAAASLFDIAWLVNVLLEWLSRYDKRKRRFSRILGWGLLAATMGAIFWHGLLNHSIPLAVVGASVSMFAKVLWLGIMRFIDRELSDLDQQWVEAEVSKANAVLAVSGVRRQVARAENRAALELLAAERERAELAKAFGLETSGAISVPVEDVFGDAVTSRRRGAISPAGEGADIRSEDDAAQVTEGGDDPDIRPETSGSPEGPALVPIPLQPKAPENRPSLASTVRGLVEGGVQDPKVIAAAASALIGHTANPESVAREIRNAKSQLANANGHTFPDGAYL